PGPSLLHGSSSVVLHGPGPSRLHGLSPVVLHIPGTPCHGPGLLPLYRPVTY
ncbi:hypothetical protein M9458_021969, partial [Cirrhinus mrigala]